MANETLEDVMARMEIGLYGHDDVERLIRAYRELRTAAMKACQNTKNPHLALVGSGLHKTLARDGYLYPFDYFHHAPRCPANNWGKQMIPSAPCNCGAKKAFYLCSEGQRLQKEGRLSPDGTLIEEVTRG